MKIAIIGGTGLLGSEAARELIARGHDVTAVALPPLPQGAVLPPTMQITYGNYLEMTDEALTALFTGCDAMVFAAGVDERVESGPPIYALYQKYNIDPMNRLLPLAKSAGVKHAVILGSYFAYFDQARPKMELSKWHPYIRSRRAQEDAALQYAGPDFDVAVLQLPYIFGTQPGRKPAWLFLVESIRAMKGATFYPRGGTAMVTVRQVGQAVAGAVEKNRGGRRYPIGYYNLTWKEMLAIMHRHMGYVNRRIITIPTWVFKLYTGNVRKKREAAGIESGLNLAKLPALQSAELFIDKSLGCDPLGVTPDDIDSAIGDSIRLCLNILDHKTAALDMKAE